MRAVFKRFGKNLQCPETDIKLYSPENLNATHDYKKKDSISPDLNFIDIS